MAKNPGIPTKENIQRQKDRLAKAKKKVDKLVQKKIDPIYFELAGKVSPWAKTSKYVPWILEMAMPVKAAQLAFRLPDPYRDPSWGRERLGITEKLAKEIGIDTKTADYYMQDLVEKTFINPTRNGYQVLRGTQVIDAIHNNPKHYKTLPPDIFDVVWVWCEVEMQDFRDQRMDELVEAGESLEGVGWRILPRWRAIKDLEGVLPVEDAREIIKAKERYCVLPCRCKERAGFEDRGCETPVETCAAFDKGVDYVVRQREAGRELTEKEFFDWYDEMGKYPLVQMYTSLTKDYKKASFCTCHWCCCLAITNYITGGSNHDIKDWVHQNRFRATIDPEECIGCRTCIDERCQFGAAQMKYYPEYGEERAYVDEEKCLGCGLCVETCTVGARKLKIVEPPEFIMELPEGRAEIAVESFLVKSEEDKAKRKAKASGY